MAHLKMFSNFFLYTVLTNPCIRNDWKIVLEYDNFIPDLKWSGKIGAGAFAKCNNTSIKINYIRLPFSLILNAEKNI